MRGPCDSTPTERLLHAAHQERLARISVAAIRQKAEIAEKLAEVAKQVDDQQVKKFFREAHSFIDKESIPISHVTIIQDIVCKTMGIRRSELTSVSRRQNITRIRQLTMYLCRECTSTSITQIARRFGGRDHSTAYHACRLMSAIENRTCETPAFQRVDREEGAKLRALIAALRVKIEAAL